MKATVTFFAPIPEGLEVLGPPPTFEYNVNLEPGTSQHDAFMSMLAGEQGLLLEDVYLYGKKQEVQVFNKNIVNIHFPEATPKR